MAGFDALGVPARILEALAKMGYAEPTPVQEKGIPPLLVGSDVTLEAQTGSGKTAAFGVPAVVVGSRGPGLRVVILVPTRELARQVAEEVRALGTGSPFRAVAVTGGVQAEQEERTLAGDVRCVVATPGRLLHLLEARKLKMDRVELVVLDEADRMLDMGFRDDIEKILVATAHRKQTALVSATLPRDVLELGRAHLKKPEDVRAGPRALPQTLTHHRLNAFKGKKENALLALLKKEDPQRAIVFMRTRDWATRIAKLLKAAGFAADALQGDMSHDQRRHVFDLFANGTTKILVATDIASRGLDVPEMELVVNFDLPDEPGAYTHRAGRAARLGRAGRVVNIVLPSEKDERLILERESGGAWEPYKIDPKLIEATEVPDPKHVKKSRKVVKPTGAPPAPARKGAPAGVRVRTEPRAPKPQREAEKARLQPKPARPAREDVPASRKGRAKGRR
ncbi:MAG TPA: DEAD/DEAH box helicase [Candidatus Thermoplasmatota archaeon]|nr:DEAD/DEAH box helicase [Candidatus Thermoplasmatota archaeon]